MSDLSRTLVVIGSFCRRLACATVFVSLLFGTGALPASASSPARTIAPVKVGQAGSLGSILVTAKGFALYRWTNEKPNTIKCTGGCATAWPPLLVPAHTKIKKTIPGVPGKFGIVVRPDKTRQVTYNGWALYTYESDTVPGEALCQAIEGWYVIQLKKH